MKKSLSFTLVLLIIFAGISCHNNSSQAVNKNKIRVPSEASDLASAVSQVSDGGTIILSPGTYKANNIDIDKAIIITSEWKETGDESKIHQTIIDAQDQVLFNIKAPGAEISGLRIIKGDHSLNITANTTVKYCHFDDNLDALSFESGSGGYAGFNVITNDRDDGMDMDIGSNKKNIGSDITVEHNSISNSNDDGIEIRLYEAPDQNIRYDIHDNFISGSKNAGIQLISYDVFTGKIFEIHHNIFTNCKTGLGCMEGSNTREDLSGATKMDELVWFYNNTLVSNQMGATGGNKIIAFNNLVLRNAQGGFKKFGPASVIKNNLFFSNGQPDMSELRGDVLQDGNIVSKDPLIDESTFTPQANSPCVNTGITSVTIEGNMVIQVSPGSISGSMPDIGAVELK